MGRQRSLDLFRPVKPGLDQAADNKFDINTGNNMADKDSNKEAADYGIGVPVKRHGFFLKGLDHVDWGMKDRLTRIFNPKSGNTVMLAFDHGYIMGAHGPDHHALD
jgi:hypothetical protein